MELHTRNYNSTLVKANCNTDNGSEMHFEAVVISYPWDSCPWPMVHYHSSLQHRHGSCDSARHLRDIILRIVDQRQREIPHEQPHHTSPNSILLKPLLTPSHIETYIVPILSYVWSLHSQVSIACLAPSPWKKFSHNSVNHLTYNFMSDPKLCPTNSWNRCSCA